MPNGTLLMLSMLTKTQKLKGVVLGPNEEKKFAAKIVGIKPGEAEKSILETEYLFSSKKEANTALAATIEEAERLGGPMFEVP